MCGIFGFVGKRERAASIDLDVALKSLHHRGPDDRGTFFGVSKRNPELACAFAHTRLSIIDLSSAGHQPMTTEDRRFTIVYNGEIYNFRELRSELEAGGVRFRSNTDTEVVLEGYRRWQAGVVERLIGMFAFAVWDEVEGSLFLTRDHFGVKPLYFSESPDGFAFASEVRTLLATGTVSRQASRSGVHSYLLTGSVSDPFTILEDAKSVIPAHYVKVKDGRATHVRYWDLPKSGSAPGDNIVDRVRSLLNESVEKELVADVPVGIFLSGGIDSSALVAMAAKQRRNIHTFTVTFDERSYSEEQYAAKIAAQFATDHHQVHLKGTTAVEGMDALLAAYDQPSADGPNTYFVSKAAIQAGLSVALSGLGSDEIFGGYGYFSDFRRLLRLNRIAPFVPMFVTNTLGGASAFNGVSPRAKKFAEALRCSGDPRALYGVIRGMFTPQQAEYLVPDIADNAAGLHAESQTESLSEDPVSMFSRFELTNYLRNTLLRDTDSMSMAHSLEIRVPFLDHKLVETIVPLPAAEKMHGQSNKPLLTSAVGELPSYVVDRPKMGFTLPLDVWSRGVMRDRVASMFLSERTPALLRPAVMKNLWKSYEERSPALTFTRMWAIAILQEWCTTHRVSLS
jgi:asparagine synthase (glutamine-hydrolysing)